MSGGMDSESTQCGRRPGDDMTAPYCKQSYDHRGLCDFEKPPHVVVSEPLCAQRDPIAGVFCSNKSGHVGACSFLRQPDEPKKPKLETWSEWIDLLKKWSLIGGNVGLASIDRVKRLVLEASAAAERPEHTDCQLMRQAGEAMLCCRDGGVFLEQLLPSLAKRIVDAQAPAKVETPNVVEEEGTEDLSLHKIRGRSRMAWPASGGKRKGTIYVSKRTHGVLCKNFGSDFTQLVARAIESDLAGLWGFGAATLSEVLSELHKLGYATFNTIQTKATQHG